MKGRPVCAPCATRSNVHTAHIDSILPHIRIRSRCNHRQIRCMPCDIGGPPLSPSSTDTFPSRSSGHSCFPRILRASCMSLHMIVTLFAWCCRSGEYIETEPTSAKTHTPLHMVQPEQSQRTRRETHRAQISIFKQSNEECLGCLLKRKNRSALEPNANSEILSNFPHLCKWGRVGGGAGGRVLCVCV
jgi:hypothetical protein